MTIGQRASEVAREWFAEDRYQDYLYLHGLCGRDGRGDWRNTCTSASAPSSASPSEEARDIEALLQQGYRGSRYSFGYPACPTSPTSASCWPCSVPSAIGISLSDEDQLDPEQSTSAIVVTHPQAKYFSV